jgi:hypothetical protein
VFVIAAPATLAAAAVACSGDGDDPRIPAGGVGGSGGGGGGAGGTTGAACAAETAVTADVSTDTTWSCPRYVLTKKIYVVSNAKLTISPGTVVVGDATITDPASKAALIVARGSQLIARGTKDRPIVFSSSNPAGRRVGGDWGGLALLGSARLNTGMPCASGAAGCKESGIEGIPATEARAKFGGTDDGGSCGVLEYVRVEFAGAELEPNRELNGITFGGCGSGTKVSHVQVHYGTDDGIEVFGGTVNMDHVVLTGNEDDSLDWDFGWTGRVQFLVVHQRAAIGDHGFEAAGSPQGETLEPRSAPTIYNATLIGRGLADGGKGIHLKEGTRGMMRNMIVQGFKDWPVNVTAKDIDVGAEWPAHLAIENTLFFQNGPFRDESKLDAMMRPLDDDKGFDEEASLRTPARNNKFDVNPMLTGLNDLKSGAPPIYVPGNAAVTAGAATPPAGFDASATYHGAFRPNDPAPWSDGWTSFPKD